MRRKNVGFPRITDIWTFQSTKTKKRYIVEVEKYDDLFYGVKFYWKGVALSPNRYSLLTNDYEPRTIVRSCIEVLVNYYRLNDLVSFGFVGASDLDNQASSKDGTRRFRFYRRLMLSLFGSDTFLQAHDKSNSMYVLMSLKAIGKGLIDVKVVEKKLNNYYCGNFRLMQEIWIRRLLKI
jgi:hypothetical protein